MHVTDRSTVSQGRREFVGHQCMKLKNERIAICACLELPTAQPSPRAQCVQVKPKGKRELGALRAVFGIWVVVKIMVPFLGP